MFATGLSSLLNQLEMSEDLFSFGPTSRLIANKLASLEQSHERKKVPSYFSHSWKFYFKNLCDFQNIFASLHGQSFLKMLSSKCISEVIFKIFTFENGNFKQ